MTAAVPAAVDLAASAVALAAFAVLHVLPTGLSPVRNPVSQYGIGRFRLGYRVLTVALGVAGLATAAGAGVASPATGRSSPGRAGIVVLLVVFGLCRLVISWWPMDDPGRPRTGPGTAHIVLAFGAFLAITVAADRMHRAAALLAPSNSAYAVATSAAFWLCAVGLAGQLVTRWMSPGHRYFGAAERLVYAGIFVLLIASGVALA